MNKREAAIITAYTGVFFNVAVFSEFHKYVEEKFNRPFLSHEMASQEFWDKMKLLSKDDFCSLAKEVK